MIRKHNYNNLRKNVNLSQTWFIFDLMFNTDNYNELITQRAGNFPFQPLVLITQRVFSIIVKLYDNLIFSRYPSILQQL